MRVFGNKQFEAQSEINELRLLRSRIFGQKWPGQNPSSPDESIDSLNEPGDGNTIMERMKRTRSGHATQRKQKNLLNWRNGPWQMTNKLKPG